MTDVRYQPPRPIPTFFLPGRGPAPLSSCARERDNRWSPQPGGRVDEEWLERKFRRPDQRGIDPEHGGDDLDELAGRGQRAPVQLGADGRRDECLADTGRNLVTVN